MKNSIFGSALAVVVFSSWSAMAAPAPGKPNVAVLEQQLAAREQRLKILVDEARSLDAGIEHRLDVIVGSLRSIADSKDSRTKVARMKEDSIDGLKRTIDYYRQKRAALQEELRRPTWNLTPEEKQGLIAKFDERIERRVQQITEINKSLPTHKDYERYQITGSDWNGPTYAVNEDFRQNQRLTSYSNSQRKKITTGLDESINRLDHQNRTLKAQLATATDEAQRKAISAEIARNEELAKARKSQKVDTLTPYETPTREVGRREAQDMDTALKKTVQDLKRDFTALFQRYNNAIAERSAVNTTRAALERARASQ